MEHFRKYLGTLISTALPHEDCPLSRNEVLDLVKSQRAMLARYTSNSDISPRQIVGGNDLIINHSQTGWWHCVRENPIDIDKLTAKQRYRVRRGLQRNNIFIADIEYIDQNADALYNAFVKSTEDYPKAYRSQPDPKDKFIDNLKQLVQSGHSDIWICQDKESRKIAGYAHTPYIGKVVFLSWVKLDPAYFKNEVNAALVYEICRHYLNDLGFDYICDGERNIRHRTAYQDFLVTVLGFRKAPCVLNIIYHPVFKPIVKTLYPIRSLFRPFRSNKVAFNIYCILYQEQCARESKKTICQ